MNTFAWQKSSCVFAFKDEPPRFSVHLMTPPIYANIVTLAEVGAASLSSDKYFFKGVFKALGPVPGAADNLCNKSRRLSDRSADTDAVLAADKSRQGELGVRLSQGTD